MKLVTLVTLVILPYSSSVYIDLKVNGGSYQIFVNGAVWLHNTDSSLTIQCNGNVEQLKITGTHHQSGAGGLGPFNSTIINWASASATCKLNTEFRIYGSTGIVSFTQIFPEGLTQANNSLPTRKTASNVKVPPIAAFPKFDLEPTHPLHFITWHSTMIQTTYGKRLTARDLYGLAAGPMLLYDPNTFTSAMLSSADNFKMWTQFGNEKENRWELGISGEVKEIPSRFQTTALIVFGDGITATVDKFGDMMAKTYQLSREIKADVSLNQLGYWTDNGAYYNMNWWWKTGHTIPQVGTPEQLLLSKMEELNTMHIPVAYMQLDDWWYPGSDLLGGVSCVKDWKAANKTLFPNGLDWFSTKTNVSLKLYVPYFCPKNAYQDHFMFETSFQDTAANVIGNQSEAFFKQIMDEGMKNYMSGFEIDFLANNFFNFYDRRTKLFDSYDWLRGMHLAAEDNKIPIQYCMAYPSDLLTSLEFPWVTNTRGSSDYATCDDWDIGVSALFIWSMHLRPSKDTFWTTSHQEGNPYADVQHPWWKCPTHPYRQPDVELQTIVATLSTGPVGFSDGLHYTNKELIMKTCTSNGTLLQPDKPITMIDRMFPMLSSIKAEPSGHTAALYSSYTRIGTRVWYYGLGIDIVDAFDFVPAKDVYPPPDKDVKTFALRYYGTMNATYIGPGDSIQIQTGGEANWNNPFKLFYLAPMDNNGWTLLGEPNKITAVSNARFSDIVTTGMSMKFTVHGAPGEFVKVAYRSTAIKNDTLTTEFYVPSEGYITQTVYA